MSGRSCRSSSRIRGFRNINRTILPSGRNRTILSHCILPSDSFPSLKATGDIMDRHSLRASRKRLNDD